MIRRITAFILAIILCLPAEAAGWLPLVQTSGGGGGGCSQATIWLSGKTTSFSAAYTTLICNGVTNGWLALTDRFYILATDNTTNALADISGSGTSATISGTATFTANSGYVSDGSTGTLNTGLNYSTATNATQNSTVIGGWGTQGATPENGCLIGGSGASFSTYLQPFNFSNQIAGGINGSSAIGVTVATGTGLTTLDRSTSTLTTAYRNGVSVGTNAAASAAIASQTAQGFECAPGTFFAHNVGMLVVGGSFGGTIETAFYNDVHTFLHTVNAALYP